MWIILSRGKHWSAVACFIMEKIAAVIARLAIKEAIVATIITGQNALPKSQKQIIKFKIITV